MRDRMREGLLIVLLLVGFCGSAAAQDRLKPGETLGAEVRRGATCEDVRRALAQAEARLTPQEVAAIRAAVFAALPECQKGDTR